MVPFGSVLLLTSFPPTNGCAWRVFVHVWVHVLCRGDPHISVSPAHLFQTDFCVSLLRKNDIYPPLHSSLHCICVPCFPLQGNCRSSLHPENPGRLVPWHYQQRADSVRCLQERWARKGQNKSLILPPVWRKRVKRIQRSKTRLEWDHSQVTLSTRRRAKPPDGSWRFVILKSGLKKLPCWAAQQSMWNSKAKTNTWEMSPGEVLGLKWQLLSFMAAGCCMETASGRSTITPSTEPTLTKCRYFIMGCGWRTLSSSCCFSGRRTFSKTTRKFMNPLEGVFQGILITCRGTIIQFRWCSGFWKGQSDQRPRGLDHKAFPVCDLVSLLPIQ